MCIRDRAKINQGENTNKTMIKEVQLETQQKLDEVQINIAGRTEIVNNEITQLKTQVVQNKETVENMKNQELINIKESIEILQNRPMYLAHHIAPEQKENINFKIYRGNPIEFLERIDEWFSRIKVTRWNVIKSLLDECFKSINDNWWSAVRNELSNYEEFKRTFRSKYWSDSVQNMIRDNITNGRFNVCLLYTSN